MKIICAGYNRTGTKSCSKALEILGYKVADLYETAEYLRFGRHKLCCIGCIIKKYNLVMFGWNF